MRALTIAKGQLTAIGLSLSIALAAGTLVPGAVAAATFGTGSAATVATSCTGGYPAPTSGTFVAPTKALYFTGKTSSLVKCYASATTSGTTYIQIQTGSVLDIVAEAGAVKVYSQVFRPTSSRTVQPAVGVTIPVHASCTRLGIVKSASLGSVGAGVNWIGVQYRRVGTTTWVSGARLDRSPWSTTCNDWTFANPAVAGPAFTATPGYEYRVVATVVCEIANLAAAATTTMSCEISRANVRFTY